MTLFWFSKLSEGVQCSPNSVGCIRITDPRSPTFQAKHCIIFFLELSCHLQGKSEQLDLDICIMIIIILSMRF